MSRRIRNRRGTASTWTSVNPVLGSGEIGIETDANPRKFKIGDGTTAWSSLPYAGGKFDDRTNSAWTSANPVVPVGDTALNTTNAEIRIGDGVSKWNQLQPNYVAVAGKKKPVRTSYHIPVPGAVPSTTTSGNAITLTGADLTNVTTHADRYIVGSTNAYFFVNSGSAIKRVTQRFSGTTGAQAVTAICLNNDASEMLHVEFGSSGIVPALWHDGDAAIQPQCSYTLSTPPSIADGNIHELTVEVFGDYCVSFIDGIACHLAFDPLISQVVGNHYYTQLTAVTSKIHGFESYSNNLEDLPVTVPAIHVGSNTAATFSPAATELVYAFYAAGGQATFEGPVGLDLVVRSTDNGGNGSRVILENQFGHQFIFNAKTNADASISYQGVESIVFSNGTGLNFPSGVSAGIGTNGTVKLNPVAGTSRIGFIEWLKNGVRSGYMGFDAGSDITLNLETGNFVIAGGSQVLAASTTARAPLRVPHGTAPTSPVDGDIWTTSAGLFVRINGATIGPLS